MKNNRIKVLPILSTIGILIFVSTLSSCAMLGLSSTKRVEDFYLKAEAWYRSGYYDAAIGQYKVALEEFEKPGVTLGARPHIDANFPALVNSRIAECYAKKVEDFFLLAETSYRSGNHGAAIKHYKVALEEFGESGVTLGIRPHIDKDFPTLVNYKIAIAYSKLAEQGNKPEAFEFAIKYANRAAYPPTDGKYKVESYLFWAELLNKTGEFELAVKKFSEFIKHYPGSPHVEDVSYHIGVFYYKQGNYKLSHIAFKRIVSKFPFSRFKHEAHYRVAEALLKVENYEEAYQEFTKSLNSKIHSSNFQEDGSYHVAYCLYQLGRYDKAFSQYSAFTTRYPKSQYIAASLQHIFSIGKFYFREKQYEKALSSYQLALQNIEKQPLKTEIHLAAAEVYLAIGKVYFGEKDYENALSTYQFALQNTEKQSLKTEIHLAIAEAHFAIGKIYFGKKDYEKALTTYQLALQNTEKQSLKTEIHLAIAEAHFAIGKIYFGKKDYEKALTTYQLALQNIEKQSLKTEILLAMAFAYFNHGNTKNAMDICKRILSVTEKDPDTMLMVDSTTKKRLTIAKGIQLYLEAENTPFLAGYKGAVAKYNAALIEILEIISTKVSVEYQSDLNYILGYLFYKVERFESAEKQLTKVIEEFPDSNFVDDARYAIGDMNYKLQSYMECRAAFRGVLDGFPNSDLRDDAQYFIAKSLLEELEYERAYLAFNELTTEDFQKYSDLQDDTRYHAAYCLSLLGRDDMAIRRYENFLEHYPKSPYRVDAYFDLGTIYARQQNYENARSNYALAMQHTDDQALLSEIQMAIGHAYYNQGDYKNAIVTHTSLLEKYPESDFIIEAKLGIANSHFRMRTWQEAADAYERVINEHPEATNFTPYCAYQVGEAHYGLATDHSEQDGTELAVKNFHKALEWYQRIVDDFPVEDSNNLGEITELLITSLTRMRNDSSVSEELQSLAQLKKGDSYLATEQYGKALAEYNTFVQMFPNSSRGPSVQDRIKQVQESIISKNLRQEKVRTAVEVSIEQQIAQKALASTVLILTTDATGDPMALGSGFFISNDQVVSNWHVVEGATTAYALSVDERTRYKIEGIIAMNPKQDLVILKVSGEGSPLPLGDSNIAQIGESIYVTGNPKGWTGTFSIGVISSFQMRYAGKRIQITAPVSPGSSGGPVLNDKGEVIGVVYAVHSGPDAQNLNLAIPVNYLKALLKRVGSPIPLSAR